MIFKEVIKKITKYIEVNIKNRKITTMNKNYKKYENKEVISPNELTHWYNPTWGASFYEADGKFYRSIEEYEEYIVENRDQKLSDLGIE